MTYTYTVSIDGKDVDTREVTLAQAEKLVGEEVPGKVQFTTAGHVETHEVKKC